MRSLKQRAVLAFFATVAGCSGAAPAALPAPSPPAPQLMQVSPSKVVAAPKEIQRRSIHTVRIDSPDKYRQRHEIELDEPSQADPKSDGNRGRSPASIDPLASPPPLARVDSDEDDLYDDEEAVIGTDPSNPDTDGDGLLDGWEINITNGEDLRAKGASPLHKDIFIEMDYMVRPDAENKLQPSPDDIAKIIEVFAEAPVPNPDRRTGINLHLELDEQIPLIAALDPYAVKFGEIKSQHFRGERLPLYRYMIWADTYFLRDPKTKMVIANSSSGVALGIPHTDFIVSLGAWNGGGGGTPDEKVGTFIHELGHTLGLRHGGLDDINNKPNHLSVMNYLFQITGLCLEPTSCNRFDFQGFEIGSVDENALDETVPLFLGEGAPRAVWTKITCPQRSGRSTVIVSAREPMDWNCDGARTPRLAADVNGDRQRDVLVGEASEWLRLQLQTPPLGSRRAFGPLGAEAKLRYQRVPAELTEKDARQLQP